MNKRFFALALAGAVMASSPALAQPSGAPGGARPAPQHASTDFASAPSGNYELDPTHTAITARLAHQGGISWSVFRFGTASGTLGWNSADPSKSTLSVTVDTKSIMTPVPGFAEQLSGDFFLNSGHFPQATFVSTKITRTGEKTGRIEGNLSFRGVTKPAAIQASFVGTGRTMRGGSAIGFTGTLAFKRSDFGFTALQGVIGDDVEIVLDVELDKNS